MKFNSQICTSRSQSERLLALGLRKETADCILVENPFTGGLTMFPIVYENEVIKDDCIPCWSLHRLIEMLGISKMAFNMDIYNSPYEEIIHRIETFVNAGEFNKEYLECI